MADDGCAGPAYGFPGMARDIFTAAENLFPALFVGARVHMQSLKPRGPTWALTHRPPPPPPAPGSDAGDASSALRSSAVAIQLNTDELLCWKTGASVRLSAVLGVRTSSGRCASGAVDVNPLTGNWSYELLGLSAGDTFAASLVTQVVAWRRPVTYRFGVDYKGLTGTVSADVDPVREQCAFQFLQAITRRLSMGAEMRFMHNSFQSKSAFEVRPAVMARYAGVAYLVSGKMNPLTKHVKLAWYHYNSDRLQTSVMFQVEPQLSIAVTRMAFRVLSSKSVFQAAIDTNGLVSSLIERQVADRVSLSVSTFLKHGTRNYGLGIGLSFS